MSRFEIKADLYLYPTEQSGKKNWVCQSYRPLGFLRPDPILGPDGDLAYGLFFELGDRPLHPGEKRRVKVSFLVQESLDAFNQAKKFYVWDRTIVGEITLADQENSNGDTTRRCERLTLPHAVTDSGRG